MSKADIRSLISRHPQLLFMPRQQAVDRCSWLVSLGVQPGHSANYNVRAVCTRYTRVVATRQRKLEMWLKPHVRIIPLHAASRKIMRVLFERTLRLATSSLKPVFALFERHRYIPTNGFLPAAALNTHGACLKSFRAQVGESQPQ